MNDFYKKQVPDPHLHLHCRPRFKNPVITNGNECIDEEFGHHYMPHKSVKLLDVGRESLFGILKHGMISEDN